MAKVILKNGVTSVVLRVKIMDSTSTTGGSKTGLTNASSGLIISTIADNEASATAYTAAGSTIDTITTLGTFAAPSANHCRFKEVDSTNHPGLYELQIADARWSVSNARSVIVTVSGATGAAQVDAEVQLSAVDLNDGVHGGMTSLPNAAAGANSGLPVVGTQVPNATAGAANGLVIAGSNAATTFTGTAASGSTPAAAGLTLIGGAASTTSGGTAGAGFSITGGAGAASTNGSAAGIVAIAGGTTTVSGNDGATFTATSNGNGITFAHAGSGLDINAQTTNSLQVDVRKILGTASKGASGSVAPDWGQVQNPTTVVGLTNTTISTGQVVGSVSGAVGSVTGNVGGNVGGNVAGSVASVTSPVSLSAPDSPIDFTCTLASQAGATSSQVILNGGPTTDGILVGQRVRIYSGTGNHQERVITSYNHTTGVTGVDWAWTTQPANGDSAAVLYADSPALSSSLQVSLSQAFPTNFAALGISGSGHITNVDTTANLTNAPTSGDLTSTMKTSVQTACDAAVTANATIVEIESETDGIAAIPTSNPSAAAIATAVWADVTSGDFTAAGSPGKILVSQLGGAFTSNSSSVFTTAALANAPGGGGNVTVGGYAVGEDPATLVLGALAASWNTASTIGAKINSAAAAGDPLSSVVPGSYAPGTAGYDIGHYLPGCFQASSYQAAPLPSSFVNSSLPTNAPYTKTFTQGDTRTNIADVLVDATSTPINLSSSTVTFSMVSQADNSVKLNAAAANIDDGPNGKVSYSWQSADVNAPGLYWGWWEVTTGGKVEHFPGDGKKMVVNIVAKLA